MDGQGISDSLGDGAVALPIFAEARPSKGTPSTVSARRLSDGTRPWVVFARRDDRSKRSSVVPAAPL